MAVIATLNYPLTLLPADDLTDVVTPDDDCSDSWTTCIRPIVGPRSRKIIGWSGIAADLRAHVPTAPSPPVGPHSVGSGDNGGDGQIAPRRSIQKGKPMPLQP